MIRVVLGALLIAVLAGGWWLYTPDLPRGQLEARYATPPSQFVEIVGLRVHLRDTGPRDAPPLILLHGFGSSLHTWDSWASFLEDHYRVIRLDLPGFGLTGPDPTGDYTDARANTVLLALMDKLGVAKATIIGHSMGGRIAWGFAAHHQDRVSRLVLISPDGYASEGIVYGQKQDVPQMMRTLPYTLPDVMFRPNVELSYGDPSHLTELNYQTYHDMMLAPGVRAAIVARMGQVVLPDPVPLLRSIMVPTLLLWGREDQMIPHSNAADYLAALPNATLESLPGLGHVPFEELPEASVQPLLAFLAAHP